MNINNLLNINWREFSIRDVLQGCAESFLSDYLDRGEAYKEVVKYRLKMCRDCPIYNNGSCDASQTIKNVRTGKDVQGCGCNIKCKTALKSMSCPAEKWLAIN